jgi:hypothetical protein
MAVVALLALSAFGLLVGQLAGGEHLPESVVSPAPGGRRALFELLGELGLRPAVWRRAPSALPEGRGLVWAAAAPEPGTPGDEEDAGGSNTADPRHPLHYARFVEEGGTLVLPAAEHGFLEEVLAEPLPDIECTALDGEEPSWLTVRGERLRVRSPWRLEVADGTTNERVAVECADEQGRAHAVAVGVGRGRLVLLADDAFLDNEAIGELDHALWAVRLAEGLGAGDPVLFDEYALGAWAPPGRLALALGPRARAVTLHVLVWLALALWASAWSREFPRDPRHSPRHSPLARARSQARLFERAGRYDLLAERLHTGVLEAAARRAGLAPSAGGDRSLLDAVAARLEARGLRIPPAARTDPRTVRTERELERLASGLDHLEAALEDDVAGGRRAARERGVA